MHQLEVNMWIASEFNFNKFLLKELHTIINYMV